MEGRLNPITGNPELVTGKDKDGKETVITEGYQTPLIYLYQDDELGYMVLSPYYEGLVPSKLIGKAIKLDGRK